MVNESKGLEYSPNKIKNRKLLRTVLRNQIVNRDGYHNVSDKVHDYYDKFKQINNK